MRHPGTCARGIVLAAALFAAAGPALAAAPSVDEARMGRHAGFHRLVVELSEAVAGYSAVAAAHSTFVISLPGARLGPAGAGSLGKARVAGYDLKADGADGVLRLTLRSPAPALIRRTFVIPPATPGGAWRLVIDLVPGPGRRPASPAGGPDLAHLALPAMHGMAPEAVPAPAAPGAPAAGPASAVEVSWARASRILQELRAHAAPGSDQPVAPQLELPEKYRQGSVPLR